MSEKNINFFVATNRITDMKNLGVSSERRTLEKSRNTRATMRFSRRSDDNNK